MVNTAEFKKAMIDAGISQRKLSEKSGISKNSLNRKINRKSEFTSSEIAVVCDCLGITDAETKCLIFLA